MIVFKGTLGAYLEISVVAVVFQGGREHSIQLRFQVLRMRTHRRILRSLFKMCLHCLRQRTVHAYRPDHRPFGVLFVLQIRGTRLERVAGMKVVLVAVVSL